MRVIWDLCHRSSIISDSCKLSQVFLKSLFGLSENFTVKAVTIIPATPIFVNGRIGETHFARYGPWLHNGKIITVRGRFLGAQKAPV
jgi:hypothetical protein